MHSIIKGFGFQISERGPMNFTICWAVIVTALLPTVSQALQLECSLVGSNGQYPQTIVEEVGSRSSGIFRQHGHDYTFRVYNDNSGALFADFNGVNDFAEYHCTARDVGSTQPTNRISDDPSMNRSQSISDPVHGRCYIPGMPCMSPLRFGVSKAQCRRLGGGSWIGNGRGCQIIR